MSLEANSAGVAQTVPAQAMGGKGGAEHPILQLRRGELPHRVR